MPSVAGSIPPLATSCPPPAVVLRPERFAASGRQARAGSPARSRPAHPRPARAAALSLVPSPTAASASVGEHAPPRLQAAPLSSAPAAVLTAIAFRPDGRPALTLRLGVQHCLAAVLTVACAVGGALALGWLLGEWTARL